MLSRDDESILRVAPDLEVSRDNEDDQKRPERINWTERQQIDLTTEYALNRAMW